MSKDIAEYDERGFDVSLFQNDSYLTISKRYISNILKDGGKMENPESLHRDLTPKQKNIIFIFRCKFLSFKYLSGRIAKTKCRTKLGNELGRDLGKTIYIYIYLSYDYNDIYIPISM